MKRMQELLNRALKEHGEAMFPPRHVVLDGTEEFSWSIEDGHLVRTHRSWNEKAIYEQNRIARNEGVRSFEWGSFALSIPPAVYALLLKTYPDLKSRDPVAKTKAWRRLAHDPDYRKLVVDRW